MVSKNTAVLRDYLPQNQLGSNCQSCRMQMVSSTGQEDCLMEVIRSQWTTLFGNSSYCKHPSAKQFVDFVNSN